MKLFSNIKEVIYFCDQPLLTARNSTEAGYRVNELNSTLKEKLKTKALPGPRGWATTSSYAPNPSMPKRHGFHWNAKEEADLVFGLKQGMTVTDLAAAHDREVLAIQMRLDLLVDRGGLKPATAPIKDQLRKQGKEQALEDVAEKMRKQGIRVFLAPRMRQAATRWFEKDGTSRDDGCFPF